MVSHVRLSTFTFFTLLAGCSVVNAPSSHTNGDGGTDARRLGPPRIRVVHLGRDTGDIDVYAGDTPIATDLTFTFLSMQTDAPTGASTFRVVREGTSDMVVEDTLDALADGHDYTLAFYGDEIDAPMGRDVGLLLLEDAPSDLDENIRLSVIHLATPVRQGNVVAVAPDRTLTTLAASLGFPEAAALPPLASMEYRVGFDAGGDRVVDVEFILPMLVPGTAANVFIGTRSDDDVFLLVSNAEGARVVIENAE